MTTARNIMGRLKPAFSTPQQPAGGGKTRRAATLVEILMSIMVMGIGLVSVASLFPISMLRSIQATQLTNASLLNYQCEDYMQAFPERLYEHFNLPLAKYQPNIEFTPDSISWNRSGVTSMAELQQTLPGNYTVVIDPIGYEYFRRLNLPASAARYGADPNGLHGANIQP
ncbi:MAG: hypothetical protein KDA78_10980, partial [Planctomycetaceae bacterium]|nr:hypothetical protein [Planctomycetaceae bacterium]